MQGHFLGLVSLGLLVAVVMSSPLPSSYPKFTYKYDPAISWADLVDLDDEDFDPFAPLPELELPPQTDNADGSHGDTPAQLDALGTNTPENPYLVHNSPLAIDRAMLEDAVADEDDAIDHPGVGLVEASTAVTDQAPATNKRKKKKKKAKKNKKETK
ncbi:hypothetical protein H4R35_007077, partial [Dimargaris xerosporica]